MFSHPALPRSQGLDGLRWNDFTLNARTQSSDNVEGGPEGSGCGSPEVAATWREGGAGDVTNWMKVAAGIALGYEPWGCWRQGDRGAR